MGQPTNSVKALKETIKQSTGANRIATHRVDSVDVTDHLLLGDKLLLNQLLLFLVVNVDLYRQQRSYTTSAGHNSNTSLSCSVTFVSVTVGSRCKNGSRRGWRIYPPPDPSYLSISLMFLSLAPSQMSPSGPFGGRTFITPTHEQTSHLQQILEPFLNHCN